jgi:hypothetical protein
MLALSLLDAAVLLFIVFRVVRSSSRTLGESLHNLIALLLIVALFLGFRMTREIRGLLSDMADMMQAIPGLGTRVLIIIGAWYLMRLLRQRSAYWIEHAIPSTRHKGITRASEGLRAVLLAGFLLWLAEGWFDRPPARVPVVVEWVRAGDLWLENQLQRRSMPSTPPSWPPPPPGMARPPTSEWL